MGWAWVRYWGKWLLTVLIALVTTGGVSAFVLLAKHQPWAQALTQRMTLWDWTAALILAAVPWWALLAVQVHRDLRRKDRAQRGVTVPLSVSASSIPVRA